MYPHQITLVQQTFALADPQAELIAARLLVTITRLPKGYRLLASNGYRMRYYCWSLYRNGLLLAAISRSYQLEHSVNFDLFEPLAPGLYTAQVECFDWPGTGEPTAPAYYTASVTIMHIGR